MKYVHWLKIDGYSKLEETALQFQSIENYLKAYPKAKAMLYQYDSGSFNWIVRLECEQCYNDLDLDVNSSSTRLERFSNFQNITKNILNKGVQSAPFSACSGLAGSIPATSISIYLYAFLCVP